MSGGRPPVPTALRVLEGNRGKRPLRREPVTTGTPPPPSWISAEARKLWARTVPELQRMGLVGKADEIALAGLFQSWSRWRDAELALNDPNLDGQDASRLHRIARGRWADVLSIAVQFGMTPVARARVATPQSLEDETLGGLLR